MSKFSVYSLCVCAACLFIVFNTPLLAQEQPAIPQQVLDWQKAAQDNVAQKNLTGAIESYQNITAAFPNTVYAYDAWVQIAGLNVQAKNFTQVQSAINQLCTAYRDQPGMFRAVFGVVEKCMYAKAYPEAISICTEAQAQLSSHPRAALVTGWLGMVYAHQGNSAQAQEMAGLLLKANSTASDFLDAMGNIGWGYYCADQWDQALTTYRRGIERQPDHKQAGYLQYHIVQTYLKKGDTASAETEMGVLLTRYGHRDYTLGLAGKLALEFRQQEQKQKAIEIYKKLLTQFSSHKDIAGVQDSLVETYADMGDLTKAQEAIKTDIEKYPGHKGLLRMITRVAVETARAGDPNKAMELTQTIFDQKPEGTDQLYAYTTKARVYVHQGKDAEAEKLVDDMLLQFKDYPKDLSYHLFGVGEEYCCIADKVTDDKAKQQAYQKATDMWGKCISANNKSSFSPRFYYFTADVLRRLKRYNEAILYYEEVASHGPSYEQGWQAQLMTAECYQGLKEQGLLSVQDADFKIIEAYKKLLKKYPNCPAAQTAAIQIVALSQK